MKTLTLKYKNYGKSIVFDSIKKAFNGVGQVDKDIIYFNDLAEMQKFLSPTRTELLSVIRRHKPESMYELAQLLDKDQAYIFKEVKLLAGIGMIKLEVSDSGGRYKTKPIVVYDHIYLDVDLSEIPEPKIAIG